MTVKEFSAIFQRFMLLRIHQNTGDPCIMLFLILKKVDAVKFTEVKLTLEILVNANSLSQGPNSEVRISQGPSLLTSCCGLLEIRQSLRHTSPKNVSDRLGLDTALLYFRNVLRIDFFCFPLSFEIQRQSQTRQRNVFKVVTNIGLLIFLLVFVGNWGVYSNNLFTLQKSTCL